MAIAKKAAPKKAAPVKATKAAKVETQVGTTFTTDSLARAISAKSADADGKTTISITQANEIVGMFKDSVMDALKEGKKVQLTGFITITPSYRNEREGNNVLTGERMTIPASVTFNCKAGKAVKDIAKDLPDAIVDAIKASK